MTHAVKLKLKVNNPDQTSEILSGLVQKISNSKEIALTNEEAAVAIWLSEVAREIKSAAHPLPNLGF